METIIKIKNAIISLALLSWEKVFRDYWPAYSGWLSQKIASYDPFAVLTISTSFALFFFLIFYWFKNHKHI